jgi:protein-S-isoprenylcysteine O-methyltransferase Ste14
VPVAVHLVLVAVAGWLYFGGGIETIRGLFGIDWQPGDFTRRLLLLSFGVILWLRLTFGMFWLLKRKFGWDELVGVLFACVVYQTGFALLGATEDTPVGLFDVAAIVLFLFGSYLNTWSEMQRKRFKADPANQGRLYTEGWFRYARHINYFGDTLWVAGWAMLTRNPWSAIVPVALAAGFVLFFIPSLTDHLKTKYGEQYDEWAKTTKRYIPFVW